MTDDTATWLAPAAHEELKRELEQLETEGRRYIEERIAEARSHGDLRENADYDAAKNEQGLMEARIRQLKHLLDNSEVREITDTDHVQEGSVVTVTGADGIEREFFVAAKENKVKGYLNASPDSPLGAALMGAEVGDTVSYQAPGGTFSYTVKAIRPFSG